MLRLLSVSDGGVAPQDVDLGLVAACLAVRRHQLLVQPLGLHRVLRLQTLLLLLVLFLVLLIAFIALVSHVAVVLVLVLAVPLAAVVLALAVKAAQPVVHLLARHLLAAVRLVQLRRLCLCTQRPSSHFHAVVITPPFTVTHMRQNNIISSSRKKERRGKLLIKVRVDARAVLVGVGVRRLLAAHRLAHQRRNLVLQALSSLLHRPLTTRKKSTKKSVSQEKKKRKTRMTS